MQMEGNYANYESELTFLQLCCLFSFTSTIYGSDSQPQVAGVLLEDREMM